MAQRHVRRPARPIEDHTPGFKGHLKRFFLSFTPRYFKSYWISRDGLRRVGKLAGAGLLFVFLVFLWYAKDLPTPGKINAKITAQSTKFYDSSGQHLLYTVYGNTNREVIKYGQIPLQAQQATIAIEDKNFYHEGPVDVFAIARSAVTDLTHHGIVAGGSTITQQYVKNALLDPTDRSFSRKIKELILSLEIAQFYSKNDIIAMYLNEIPYGSNAYGIETACKTYFPQDIDHKSTDQLCSPHLTLGQDALLAAILNAPTYYSPYGENRPELISRQHLVLQLMQKQGYITADQEQSAEWSMADLSDASKISQTQNLYANLDPKVASFVLYAQDFLENKLGASAVEEGGLKVYTTMDYNKQMQAYDAVQKGMPNVRAYGGSNAAFVAADPNSGHIEAMLGSYNFNDPHFGNYNVAIAQRQPGSSFKPIVYSTLFGENANASCAKTRACPTYGAGTTMYDVPTNFGSSSNPYQPHNFGNKTFRTITIRQALAGSLNIPAVKALAMAGIPQSIQTAQRLGISTLTGSPDSYGLSLVLGSGGVELTQMTNAYESFANGGLHYASTPIMKVLDQHNNTVVDNTHPQKPTQALDPQVSWLIADMLADNNAKQYIFGNLLALHNNCGNNQSTNCVHVGVKTGTTDSVRDAWTIGFTNNLVAGVWAGNNDNAPMTLEAADISAPIWANFMNAVLNGQPTPAWQAPSGIKKVTLDKNTGRAATAGTSSFTNDYFPSWYTPISSTGGRSAVIDKVSGNLATNCTPALAKKTIYSSAIQPEITYQQNPSQYNNWLAALQQAGYATSGGGNIPTASDTVHSCSDSPPTVSIGGASGGGPYTLNITVGSGSPFTPNHLNVYFDSAQIADQSINGPGTYQINYTPTATGTHTFKAEVIDSGYYSGTDTAQVDVTYSGGSNATFHGTLPGEGSTQSAGAVQFSWTDDGSTNYTLHVGGSSYPVGGATTTSVPLLKKGHYTWYVDDGGGNTTGTMDVNIQ